MIVPVGHRAPCSAVLRQTERLPVRDVAAGEHRGLQPDRRQVRVDLVDANAVDVVDLKHGAAHERVVDREPVAVVVEVRQREEHVVARVVQEDEVLGQIVDERVPPDDDGGLGGDELGLCDMVSI